MAYFGRAIEYAGTDNEGELSGYCAVIEIVRRKGGKPLKYFVYRYLTGPDGEKFEMMEIGNRGEALKVWPSGFGRQWQKTNAWLTETVLARSVYRTSNGKWREHCPWVRVHVPSPWKKSPKKKALQIGSNAHILLAKGFKLRSLENEKMELESILNNDLWESYRDDNGFDHEGIRKGCEAEFARIEEKIALLEDEISAIELSVLNTKDELRFAYARKVGKPYFPRDREMLIPSPPATA